MKSVKDFSAPSRKGGAEREDSMRKASKLSPFERSGKERHNMYKSIKSEDDEDFEDDYKPEKRESAFDYFDDDED